VHLCCNWVASCVAVYQTKNQKPKQVSWDSLPTPQQIIQKTNKQTHYLCAYSAHRTSQDTNPYYRNNNNKKKTPAISATHRYSRVKLLQGLSVTNPNFSWRSQTVTDTVHLPTRARGGEGALAPSCHVPQGHDRTRENFIDFFASTCGSRSRRSTKCRPTTEVVLSQVGENKYKFKFLPCSVASRVLPTCRDRKLEKKILRKTKIGRSLVVTLWRTAPRGNGRYVPRELGRIDWWWNLGLLAQGCMPARKYCELLLPTGSARYQVGNGPRKFIESNAINWVQTTRLVQWLKWLFTTQETQKERKIGLL